MISEDQRPKAKENGPVDWSGVERILIIRLRSIGDTVLITPSLTALRKFLPEAQIDILLETHVAPVLDGFDAIDNVITVGESASLRIQAARQIRQERYDAVFNLHGGTTSVFFTAASGARHRFGFSHYPYSFIYNHRLSSAVDFWDRQQIHSAEQHLALFGFAGVPVDQNQKTRLAVTETAKKSVGDKLSSLISDPSSFILIHPAAAFATKQWPTENFARVAEYLYETSLQVIAIAAKNEREVLEKLARESKVSVITFDDLTLPEITALASQAKLFVGNDSGIAHIAAAVNTPSVVIFGSSDRDNWRPWTDAPNEIVFEQFHCQPCPGRECKEFGEPRCILSIKPESVFAAIEKLLAAE